MIDYNISAPKEKFFGLRMVFCLNVDEENSSVSSFDLSKLTCGGK